jgi:4-amino-4-deoxy-L-arabinose transferase-like glycosyltransferase
LLSSVLGFLAAPTLLLVFYFVRTREERGWLMALAVSSFLLKAVLVPIYFLWLASIGEEGFAYFDAGNLHYEGIHIAEGIRLNVPRELQLWWANDPGPYYLTAYMYIVFGPNTLVYRFFLIMCVSFSLLYMYRITRFYYDERTARLAALLQAFVPAPILLSLNHRKDPIVQLIVLFSFYHSIRLFRQEPGWFRSILPVVLGMVALYPFRSGMVLPFIGVMLIGFVLANRNIVQGVLLTFVTLVAVVSFQVAGPEDSRINFEKYTSRTEGKFDASTGLAKVGGVARLLRVTGPQDVYKIPFAAGLYLILPFPPELNGYEVSILSSFLNLVGVFLLPHMLLGAWSLTRGPDWRLRLPLLVFPVTFLLLLGTVHIGVVRYKEIFYPICLIWAAIGWRIGTNLFLKLAVYGGLSLLGLFVYMNRYGLI